MAMVDEGSKEGSSSQQRPTHRPDKHRFKQEWKSYPPLPPLLYNKKKAAAVLKQWEKDSIVQLSFVNQVLTQTEERTQIIALTIVEKDTPFTNTSYPKDFREEAPRWRDNHPG